MKLLQVVVLSATCVGYVIASHLGYVGYDGLYRAIYEGRLDIAAELVKQDETLVKDGLSYVIGKDDPDLIADFVNQTNQANATTLNTLWRKRRETARRRITFTKVLDKVDFPQQVLVDMASSYVVALDTEDFLVVFNKIVKPEDQENAIENAIGRLAHNPTETSRLLNALKGKTFRSERLEQLAIQKAFMGAVETTYITDLSTDIFKHTAITPELYAKALIVTDTESWGYDGIRQFLLKNADRYDLQAVKEEAGYAGLRSEFRNAIEEALGKAAPEGTRTRAYDIQTLEKARETFEWLGHPGISEDVFSIVAGSVMRDPPKGRIAQTTTKEATKNVASDVTSASTEIEGSGDIGNERVGEDQA